MKTPREPSQRATTKRVAEAVSNFRAKFLKTTSDFELGYNDSLDYFTVMASLSRLLNDPSMQAFLKQLDTGQETDGRRPDRIYEFP